MATSGDVGQAIKDLGTLAADNREFQKEVMRISIQMNIDNKLGQKAGDVGK